MITANSITARVKCVKIEFNWKEFLLQFLVPFYNVLSLLSLRDEIRKIERISNMGKNVAVYL